ncbi:MAG: 3-deoxy-D-manno-octulosonic acid transferase, partial [Desulfonatronovibrio sp.]
FIVLGSIRREEEIKIQWLIKKITQENPKTTIALFPRHMKRLTLWENFLNRHNITWVLRSQIENRTSPYNVILWDKFGELVHAYALAKSVYVGGSLVPCGGQNFLEPVSQGVIPCIGPFWDNFHWVGKEFLSSGLIHQINDEKELYSKLIAPGAHSKEKI